MTLDSELLEKFHEDEELVDALQYLDAVEREHGVQSDTFVEALLQMGHLLHQRGNFLDALGYFIRGRGVLEAREEQLHPLMSDLLAGMGENYLLQNMLQEAQPYLEKAISVREALCVAENPETAMLLMKTAEINVMQGELFPAHEQLTRAYQILCEVSPENYELLGEASHNLGVLLISQKHYDRAMECLKKACDFREKYFDKNSLERSDSLVAYAAACKEVDKNKEGLHALYEAMTIREEILGSEHEAVQDIKDRYRALSEGIDDREVPTGVAKKVSVTRDFDAEILAALISTAVMAVQKEQQELALKLLELSKQALGSPDEIAQETLQKIQEVVTALSTSS